MVVKKILFPTRFREYDFNCIESFFVLKNAGLKEIILLHVISREEVGFVPFGGYLKEEEEKKREEARIRFEDWQRSITEKGIKNRFLIEVGELVPLIFKTVKEENIDLIVIGEKKREDDTKSHVGIYTHEIMARIDIPTLVKEYMVRFELGDTVVTKVNDRIFEMPLIAVDWSEISERVIEFVISLKGAVNNVCVFHTIPEENDADEMRRKEDESVKKLKAICKRLKTAGIKAEYHLGAGVILDEMLRVSRERNAGIIIIGNTVKDHFMKDMLHMSLSYNVAKRSELPTLLIP